MTDKSNLLLLFDRPAEPIFLKKGEDNATFDLPESYWTDHYKPFATDITTRLPGSKTINVSPLPRIPDIKFLEQFPRDKPFSLFNKYHSKLASSLIQLLMAARNTDELLSLSLYIRDRINPYLFIYAMSVVMLHRPDTKNLELPSHAEMFPSLYMNPEVFTRAREESEVVDVGSRSPIELPFNGSSSNQLDLESRLQYFREDIGVNLHHWHWHLVYPFEGPNNIVDKDRRGELFYYMHQQIVARYNMERLSNGINRVVRLTNWRDPIPEGYFPKLDNVVANRVWPPRHANSIFSNVNRESDQVAFDIEDLERWRDRLFTAIHSGFIIDRDGNRVRLLETNGIDILGNLIESSSLSLNPILYGSLHNNGHLAIAYIHDPDNRYLENFSVMGDSTTAMRDPVFYRWHAYIDDIFQEFKRTIPAYSVDNLSFENVRVQSVDISIAGLKTNNEFSTFWQQSDVDLSRGLDFSPRGAIFARFTHLQHAPFSYKIIVENNGNQRTGTVRIFIAPKKDERGEDMLFGEQRKLFVELDKFSTTLKRGRNEIIRQSTQSSVTIPHEVTYRNLRNRTNSGNGSEEFNFCGCGWPQNMLIPKGNFDGFPCQLFVMVSNGANDQVQGSDTSNQTCDNASSYCGVRNAKYPDARAMGYPFDRIPRDGVITIQNFLTPNMTVRDVNIRFANRKVATLPSRPNNKN